MNIALIDLKDSDFQIVKEIYDYYILNSTATFHTEPISITELKEAIYIAHPRFKSFLIQANSETIGFCYYNQFKKRQAYDKTAEVTIYLRPEWEGKGIGKQVLNTLIEIAKEADMRVLLGVICAENKGSIALFEKCGFVKCAHFEQVGEKFERILDIVIYQKLLI